MDRVSENLVVKVADFGLSRDVHDTDIYRMKETGKLPVKWMAVECLERKTFTTMSDVVSMISVRVKDFFGQPNVFIYFFFFACLKLFLVVRTFIAFFAIKRLCLANKRNDATKHTHVCFGRFFTRSFSSTPQIHNVIQLCIFSCYSIMHFYVQEEK